MRNLCVPRELEIEIYWNQLRDVYNAYLEQHNPIMGHYNTLWEKDDFYQRDIAKNDALIQQASVSYLNKQLRVENSLLKTATSESGAFLSSNYATDTINSLTSFILT